MSKIDWISGLLLAAFAVGFLFLLWVWTVDLWEKRKGRSRGIPGQDGPSPDSSLDFEEWYPDRPFTERKRAADKHER